MKVIKEDVGTKAWMIRNDGKEFPVLIHYYGSEDPNYIEETLMAAEWLYDATNHFDLKRNIIKLIAIYADYNTGDIDGDRIDVLFNIIANKPYRFLSPEFVKKHEEEILYSDTASGLKALNTLICNELNQEFIRARFGGVYNSSPSSGEMTFRVSSTGFNWINIIYNFVAKHRNMIKSVTIVRDDDEGKDFKYFYDHNGEKYNQLPINDFLTQSGNPIIENMAYISEDGLASGKSINESFSNMNIVRKNNRFNMLHDKESMLYK